MIDKNFIIRFFQEEEWQSVNYTIRWNGKRRSKDETLKDHLFLCGLFTTILVEDILPGEVQFHLDSTRAALFHDFVDESITGDLSHDLKYNEINGEALRSLLFDYVLGRTYQRLNPEKPSEKILIDSIQYDKTSCIYKMVKFVDWMTCYYYVCQEIELGNKSFQKYLKKIENHIEIVSKDLIVEMDFSYQKKFNKQPIIEILEFVKQNNKSYVE